MKQFSYLKTVSIFLYCDFICFGITILFQWATSCYLIRKKGKERNVSTNGSTGNEYGQRSYSNNDIGLRNVFVHAAWIG